jgi:hypothetical protein
LTDIETGATPRDQAAFIGHYQLSIAFDGPDRRADFHKRTIAELKSLDAAHTEHCGSLSRLLDTGAPPYRCQQCYAYPLTQCELRIVEEIAGTVLDEQKAAQLRARAMTGWQKTVWPVWAALSWIVFRRLEQICAVVDGLCE